MRSRLSVSNPNQEIPRTMLLLKLCAATAVATRQDKMTLIPNMYMSSNKNLFFYIEASNLHAILPESVVTVTPALLAVLAMLNVVMFELLDVATVRTVAAVLP